MEEVEKRETADLIPYKIVDATIFVFLQKRDGNAKVLPNMFSFFGGKLEPGETHEQAMIREIKEELNFTPTQYKFLGTYNSSVNKNFFMHMYYEQVEDNFEDIITVSEGECGKFLSEEEALDEPMLIESDKKILEDFFAIIKNK